MKPGRASTNFKRRGISAPAGAVTTPQPKPTGNEGQRLDAMVDGSMVTIREGNRRVTIQADGSLHASIIARAIVDGAVTFSVEEV